MWCDLPPTKDLVRGAIIGTAEVVGWITTSQNPWWMGPGALVLDKAKALPEPVACGGQLGWFDWKPSEKGIAVPAKWMLPKDAAPSQPMLIEDKRQEELL